MTRTAPYAAVFFDLDGTLIDSAPDLAAAANDMRLARGWAPLPLARYRPLVGRGARGMVTVAFADGPGRDGLPASKGRSTANGNDNAEADDAARRSEFLQYYERRMLDRAALFPGVAELLQSLRAAAVPWGIVTNKAIRYAEPICRSLGLTAEAAALIGGDTTPHSKPHPAPLLAAATRASVDPTRCAYVGDDLRDIQAGRAAGMTTIAAAWGYLGDGLSVGDWRADHIAQSPKELHGLLISGAMP